MQAASHFLSSTLSHFPTRDIKKYRRKYDAGYEPIRNARFEKMKKLGVINNNTKLSPLVGKWDKVEDKKWEAACMEVYAAMLDNMDQGIGRILGALKKKKVLENTLVFYLQDNGGCAEGGGRGPAGNPRADKPTLEPIAVDALHYFDSIPSQTRDGYPVRRGHVMPGPADTYIGYGKQWANVSNTPFREYKHWVHEGGISTPLVVHWPKGIKEKNELRNTPSHLVDIMATCIDVSGAKYPSKKDGGKIKPMEGKSLVPVFENKSIKREAIYWEHEGNRAVRLGKWKAVAKGKHGEVDVGWELYDTDKDRSELNDLSEKEPERLKKIKKMWLSYAKRADVIPWPNPRPPRTKKKRQKKKQ